VLALKSVHLSTQQNRHDAACYTVLTRPADRALQALVARTNNSVGRWICQHLPVSSAVVILPKKKII
jgi:hypothetical protein